LVNEPKQWGAVCKKLNWSILQCNRKKGCIRNLDSFMESCCVWTNYRNHWKNTDHNQTNKLKAWYTYSNRHWVGFTHAFFCLISTFDFLPFEPLQLHCYQRWTSAHTNAFSFVSLKDYKENNKVLFMWNWSLLPLLSLILSPANLEGYSIPDQNHWYCWYIKIIGL